MDAPHYQKDFGKLHPYVDKTVEVSLMEEKPVVEQIKEQWARQVEQMKENSQTDSLS